MKSIRFLSENFHFLEVKFSIYLNKRVFVMSIGKPGSPFFTMQYYISIWVKSNHLCFLCRGFTAQSTQWGHIERGQFPNHTFTGQA